MAKANNKTVETDQSVSAFIEAVEHPRKRADAQTLDALFSKVTGEPAKMWGKSLIGYGRYQYKYESGREGEFFLAGFSPRKSSLVLYIMPGFSNYDDLMGRLGKHKTGKSCLYINKLADVDMDVLEELVVESVQHMREKYPD